jgi:regulatory protein
LPRITGLKTGHKKAKVFVEGEIWAELPAGLVAERGLSEGLVLSEEELEEIGHEGERALAMERALRLLSYRSRSAGEVASRLRRHGHREEVVEEVLGRLEELGYIDDAVFARELARERSRGYGARRVLEELRKKGVDREVAREAVDREYAGRSELEEARDLASRRYNNREGSDAQARRVYGFLRRRGYPADVCAEVARGYR